MQDFLLDENHNLTEMEENTAESHVQVKFDEALFYFELVDYFATVKCSTAFYKISITTYVMMQPAHLCDTKFLVSL